MLKNHLKRYLVIVATTVACFACVETAFGQQDPQFSQYMFARLPVNPAYAGSNEAICASLLYRNQWTGFGGEPKTSLFAFDMPVEALHGGVGLSVYGSDRLGAESNLNIRGAYAYRTDLGAGRLGIGVDIGYHQKSIDGSKFVFNDAGDNNIGLSGQKIIKRKFDTIYRRATTAVGFFYFHRKGRAISTNDLPNGNCVTHT